MALDRKDFLVLSELYEDARMPVSEISRKTGIQRDSIVYRINKMKKDGVIKSFVPVLDSAKIGFPIYSYVTLSMKSINSEKEKSFLSFCEKNPFITYIASLSGKWDYEIVISAENIEHLNAVLKEIRNNFSELIQVYESTLILSELKYDFLLGLVDVKTRNK
ncbi:MAG: winged helix-turn-helix transcriptional regulator [Candidatus Diapherotrites archaeon]|nr:winged helix-turn-helix transcriptional regulator [Candidatus Diapherotrites archaeon]